MKKHLQKENVSVWSEYLVNNFDMIGVKMRGLPFDASHSDIKFFFSDYKLILDSIKIGMNGDRKSTGEAAALF